RVFRWCSSGRRRRDRSDRRRRDFDRRVNTFCRGSRHRTGLRRVAETLKCVLRQTNRPKEHLKKNRGWEGGFIPAGDWSTGGCQNFLDRLAATVGAYFLPASESGDKSLFPTSIPLSGVPLSDVPYSLSWQNVSRTQNRLQEGH